MANPSTNASESPINILKFTDHENISIQCPFDVKDFKALNVLGSSCFTVRRFLHEPTERMLAVKELFLPTKNRFANRLARNKNKNVDKLKKEWYMSNAVGFCENIIKYYGIGFHENRVFLCSELMDMSLADFKTIVHSLGDKKFPNSLVFSYIAHSILNALEHCRQKNIVHGDVKPANFLVNKGNGLIKLCDFDAAYFIDETLKQSYTGTIAYWPPEKLEESLRTFPRDSKADVWSLGVTLYELCFGKNPFIGLANTEINVLQNIKNTNIPKLVQSHLDKVDLINQNIAGAFIINCLSKYERRPTFDELMKSEFYEEIGKRITRQMSLMEIRRYEQRYIEQKAQGGPPSTSSRPPVLNKPPEAAEGVWPIILFMDKKYIIDNNYTLAENLVMNMADAILYFNRFCRKVLKYDSLATSHENILDVADYWMSGKVLYSFENILSPITLEKKVQAFLRTILTGIALSSFRLRHIEREKLYVKDSFSFEDYHAEDLLGISALQTALNGCTLRIIRISAEIICKKRDMEQHLSKMLAIQELLELLSSYIAYDKNYRFYLEKVPLKLNEIIIYPNRLLVQMEKLLMLHKKKFDQVLQEDVYKDSLKNL